MRELTKKEKAFLQYGFLLFLISLTTYLVSTTLDIKLIPHIIKMVNKKYLFIAILLIVLYILFESVIIQIIINAIEKVKIKFIGPKIATMGLYYNLVTPMASGSQPIQIYALTKSKVSISKSIAIVTNKTVLFQSLVTIYCGILVVMNIDLLKHEMPSIMILVTAGMTMNIFMLLGGLLIVFSPKKLKLLIDICVNILIKFKVFKFLENKKEELNKYIDEYNLSIRIFIKNKKALTTSIILTLIQLTIYFSIVYCIYRAFNLNSASYFKVLTLQVFLYMAISPIPTPGNVGANELAFLTIFADVIPKELIGYSVFLYSGFVYYFVIILCGILTVYTHYSMGKNKKNKVTV